jgi:DNA primase
MTDRSDIDAVLARVDLVSLIEQYTTLKRAGRSFKGLCPFHQEKTPSFNVNPDLGLWRCFGQCSEGGDAIKFLQKIENLTFPEALERLALRTGVTLTKFEHRAGSSATSPAASGEAGERDRLYRVNALALAFYRETLGRAAEAREYLQTRGLSHAIQEAFQIGFAAEDWEGLTAYLSRKGVALADAERAGLVSKNERGGYFDKLRGRLVFPIFDVQERPVAFGGRLIGEAKPGQPKYWNSPESPVFSKSKTLYGLWRARKAISARGHSVVVEGYTDVTAAHQAGFENVVATLGTSLTEEHVRILGRLAPVVLLAFDADSAGLKAAFRAAEMFEAQDVEVKVLDLPEGEDPDSLLRGGKQRIFEQAVAHPLPLVEYRLQQLIRRSPLETERERVDLFRKALPIVAAVPSSIEREQYIKMLAPYHPHYRAGTVYAEDHIRQDVAGFGQTRREWGTAVQEAMPRPQPSVRLTGSAAEQAERHLFRALIGDDIALADQVRTGIAPDQFHSEMGRALAREIYRRQALTPDLSPMQLLASLEDDAQQNALSALLMEDAPEPLTAATLADEIAHLKRRAVETLLDELRTRLGNGQASLADQQQIMRLSAELKGTRTPQNMAGAGSQGRT